MKNIFLVGVLLFNLLGCQKIEGEGGKSTIIGTVKTININSNGEEIATYPAADEDVYIIYGSGDNYFDDKIETSYDGSFKFSYLTPGDYSIFIYSECNTCPSNNEAVIKKITISAKDEVVDAGELVRYD
ncbi:MAG: hypothetical protein AB8B74_04665 [Crocinitomicaceae bacterium]